MNELVDTISGQQIKISQAKGDLNLVSDKLSYVTIQKEVVNDELQAAKDRLQQTQVELEQKKNELVDSTHLLKLVETKAKELKKTKDEAEKEIMGM